jgi:hypothetical protein
MSCFPLSHSIYFNGNFLLQATFADMRLLHFALYCIKAYDNELKFVRKVMELRKKCFKRLMGCVLYLTAINTSELTACRL